MVVKSANRTVIDTVRPATPATRIRLATLAVSRSSSRRITSRSSMSRPKVSWAPIDLSGSPPIPNTLTRPGVTSRRSLPQARSWSWLPSPSPTARWRVRSGVCATSPTVTRPSRCSIAWVFSPTPHSSPTSSGCRNEVTSSGGTTTTPSGLARRLASLATEIEAATPTEQVIPCSSWIVARSCSAICERRARAGGSSRGRRGTPRRARPPRPAG